MVPYRAGLITAAPSRESASSQRSADSAPHCRSAHPPRRLLALPPPPPGGGCVSKSFVNGSRGATGTSTAQSLELPGEVFPIIFQVWTCWLPEGFPDHRADPCLRVRFRVLICFFGGFLAKGKVPQDVPSLSTCIPSPDNNMFCSFCYIPGTCTHFGYC